MLGIFAGSTILMEYARDEKAAASELVKVSRFRWPGRDLMNNVGTIFQSWGIGAVIGFLPGMGSALSNVVAYAKAKGSSKHPEEFEMCIRDSQYTIWFHGFSHNLRPG